MARGNTCGGTDNTLPRDLLEELRKYLYADPKRTEHYRARTGQERKNLDDDDCCLLEDLGGIYCGGNSCCHAADGNKTSKNKDGSGPPYRPRKPIDKPVPND